MKDLRKSLEEDKKLALIESLRLVEPLAIRQIAEKIKVDVGLEVIKSRLPKEDIEELVHDSIIVLINAIKNGKYQYQGFHPGAYALAIAKNLISNKRRTLIPQSLELNEVNALSDFDPDVYLKDKERQNIVKNLLSKLNEKCSQLIRLKYFEGMKDKEVVEKQLTTFTSTDSLKSKRSQCMRKLADLAKKAGIKGAF